MVVVRVAWVEAVAWVGVMAAATKRAKKKNRAEKVEPVAETVIPLSPSQAVDVQ